MAIVYMIVNGFLALLYVFAEHITLIITALSIFFIGFKAPREQRPFLLTGILPLLACAFVPPPVPIIMAAMAALGALAVNFDKFNPQALRWKVLGGLILYSLASLSFAFYLSYVSKLSPMEWARLTGSLEEATALMASGRGFINTLGLWGVWLIIPLGYFSLLIQGFFVHPPVPASPADMIWRIRERKKEKGEEEEIL